MREPYEQQQTGWLVDKVVAWGEEKSLNDPKAQLNKVIEEIGEVAHEITRNNLDTKELKDGIGDTLVTLIILANICGTDVTSCLELAYNEIKDRTGTTENGTFIKNAS